MEIDLEDKEGHIRYKNPIQHKVHKDLIIFHINIRFLKLEQLEFKISIILGSTVQNISFPIKLQRIESNPTDLNFFGQRN